MQAFAIWPIKSQPKPSSVGVNLAYFYDSEESARASLKREGCEPSEWAIIRIEN